MCAITPKFECLKQDLCLFIAHVYTNTGLFEQVLRIRGAENAKCRSGSGIPMKNDLIRCEKCERLKVEMDGGV